MLVYMWILGIGVMGLKRQQAMDKTQEEKNGKRLLRQIAEKDRKAFESFYYQYAERIGGYLYKMLHRHDWVDEAVNDVMLTVWQSAERFDPERGKISTWLFGIAHNKGLKMLERSGRRMEIQLSDSADEFLQDDDDEQQNSESTTSSSDPEQHIMGRQLGEALSAALSRLSEEHRCVIELCFKNGCSYQDIAEVMGCPENTVKTRMFHARKNLAEELKKSGFNPAELEWVR